MPASITALGKLLFAAALVVAAGGCPRQATPPPVDAGWPCQAGEPCDDGDPCTVEDRCTKARQCEGEPKNCDDGAVCTENSCEPGVGCVLSVKPGFCFVDGECHDAGLLAPGNPCRECRPEEDPLRWVPDDDNQCDDGDPCSLAEHCYAGLCLPGGFIDCEDGDPCTENVCLPEGCSNPPSPEGAGCPGGKCVEGMCESTCVPDCKGKVCHKDDGCGKLCGCDDGLVCCDNGTCMDQCPCYPECYGKECGKDGCGGKCGQCEHKEACAAGKCTDLLDKLLEDCKGKYESSASGCPPWLGDEGCCDAEDRAVWCHEGFVYCHDCEWGGSPVCGWSKSHGGYRCDTKGYQAPEDQFPKQCGHTCYPPCEKGEMCNGGSCEPCTCKDKECGGDSCGLSCGDCAAGQTCLNFVCAPPQSCKGSCGNVNEPSPDGCFCDGACFVHGDCCPDVCEECPALWGCSGCQADCQGKECGSDGCGGVCGECSSSEQCWLGQCVAVESYCPGAAAPIGDDCGGLGLVGCCDEEGRLKYCMNGALHCLDCPTVKPSCGWNAGVGWYDCGMGGGEARLGGHAMGCE